MAQQRNRARQRQRQRIIAILLLVVLGAAGFFLFSKDDKPKKRKKRAAPVGMVKMPTLKRNVGPGTRLSKAHIRNIYRTPREVPTDAVLALDQIVGRFTTHPIFQGQYIREGDVGPEGVTSRGFSSMTRPGMRLVVLSTKLFPGSLHTLKVGDRIDLMALERTQVASGGRAAKAKYSPAIDGIHPGARPQRRTSRNKNNLGTTLSDPGTISATLIAENAEVMSVPKTNKRGRNVSGHSTIVLQMHPQDAHVTTLMAASRRTMRAVFRPFGDETRLTQPKPLTATTELPKPKSDPDVINVIVNGRTYLSKPNSTMYRYDDQATLPQGAQPRLIYGRERAVDTTGSNTEKNNGLRDEYKLTESDKG